MGVRALLLGGTLAVALWPAAGCGGGGSGGGQQGCDPGSVLPPGGDFRQAMREFVQDIGAYARTIDSDFIVIPQNGHGILSLNPDAPDTPATDYMAAIDGVGREDLFYGYDDDNVATPPGARDEMLSYMDLAVANGITVLFTDYCWDNSKMDDTYAQADVRAGYIGFAADHRDLDNIPDYPASPHDENANDVTTLAGARNFLYVLDTAPFASKAEYIAALAATNFDALIIDAFCEGAMLTPAEVSSFKTKANGGSRLVISYMSIGEAEDYRYYWDPAWSTTPPDWLAKENSDWPGNFKVRYWLPSWQDIILGADGTYLKNVIDAGFDGVYLDIIDAFECFEAWEG